MNTAENTKEVTSDTTCTKNAGHVLISALSNNTQTEVVSATTLPPATKPASDIPMGQCIPTKRKHNEIDENDIPTSAATIEVDCTNDIAKLYKSQALKAEAKAKLARVKALKAADDAQKAERRVSKKQEDMRNAERKAIEGAEKAEHKAQQLRDAIKQANLKGVKEALQLARRAERLNKLAATVEASAVAREKEWREAMDRLEDFTETDIDDTMDKNTDSEPNDTTDREDDNSDLGSTVDENENLESKGNN